MSRVEHCIERLKITAHRGEQVRVHFGCEMSSLDRRIQLWPVTVHADGKSRLASGNFVADLQVAFEDRDTVQTRSVTALQIAKLAGASVITNLEMYSGEKPVSGDCAICLLRSTDTKCCSRLDRERSIRQRS